MEIQNIQKFKVLAEYVRVCLLGSVSAGTRYTKMNKKYPLVARLMQFTRPERHVNDYNLIQYQSKAMGIQRKSD